jgi:uncharacterized protein (DUF2126 family)
VMNPDTGPMAAYVDPHLIVIGRFRLTNNLGRSLLLPGELEVITGCLDALHSADEALREVGVADVRTFELLAGQHMSLVGSYRRTLARYGART